MKHTKWTMIIDSFDDMESVDLIQQLVDEGKNVLVMIKKKENEEDDRREKVFKELCERFPDRPKDPNTDGRIIFSTVPDVNEVINVEEL